MKLLATLFLLLFSLPATLSAQEWVQRADVPFGETDAPIGFAIDDKVYLGAGIGNKRFYEYNTKTMKWTRRADIPGVNAERAFGSGFAINGKGYVGFGYDGSPQTMKDLWEYDPSTDKWTRKADLPGEARDGATVFVLNGKAYIGGGSDNEILFEDLWMYDPQQDKWTQLGDLPTGPVIFQSSLVIENAAYIIGGSIGSTETNKVFRYDPENDMWEPRADFPGAARQAAVSFNVGAVGYVGGGHSKFEEIFSDFYSFIPYTNTWTKIEGVGPGGRAWATGISTNGNAFIGTGFDFQNFLSDWWEFGTSTASVDSDGWIGREFAFYPNPASSQVTLNMANTSEVTIYDQLGRTIELHNVGAGTTNFDVRHLTPGVYHLRIHSGDKGMNSVLQIVR